MRASVFGAIAATACLVLVALGAMEGSAAAKNPSVHAAGQLAPSRLAISARSTSALALTWHERVAGVRGYRLFLNGRRFATKRVPRHPRSRIFRFRFTRLVCGRQYRLGVRAVDAAGKLSKMALVRARTRNCTTVSGVNPPPASGTSTAGVSCSQTVGSEAAIVSAVGSAPGGSTVCIAGGSYGAMTWTGGGSRTSPVTVVPAPGASVVFTGPLKEDASYVTLESVNLSGQRWEIDGPTSNVTMENIVAANFWIGSQPAGGVRNITVLGGSLGPNHTYPDNIIGSNGSSAVNTNVVIDGVLFHDQTRSSSSSHFECLQVWNADGLTIENSKFVNCSVFSIELQHVGVGSTSYPPPTPTNVTIQNNWLDCCTDFTTGVNTFYKNYAVLFASDDGEGSWKDVVVRNNSGDDGLDFGSPSGDAVSYSNVRVENNAMPNWNVNAAGSSLAPAGISVDYNEWFQGSKVGAHDLGAANPTSIFAGWAGGNMPGSDLHEVAGAPTVGKGDPNFYPPTDIDGNPRTTPPTSARSNSRASAI